ncbi:glucose-6-phosphate dehydrogenase assembly protein OpcA [Trichothermofontia sp.]
MTTITTPLISLQSPKDVSLGEIEAELSSLWQNYGPNDSTVGMPTRASTFTLIIYEPDATQQLLAMLGYYQGPLDGITGPRTEAALRQAQTDYGLKVTGRSDRDTLNALYQAFLKRQTQTEDATNGISPSLGADLSASGFADAIATQNPCRVIALCVLPGEDEGVTAQVSAYCPIHKQNQSSLICCEYITLRGTATALSRNSSLVTSLLIGQLPKFLWWKASPQADAELFQTLAEVCDCTILDSSNFDEPEPEILRLQSFIEAGTYIADLNWRRLAAWQELAAEAFDPPERRAAIYEVDRVTIDYEYGNPAQALMYLGWLASRLDWKPVRAVHEGGDYDLRRVYFESPTGRAIEAELAALPVADVGEVIGDLIDLRLASTNPDADCCTILCSETMGCMRMEAGGGAQSGRIQQVTPLTDQKAETLLGQQLQRWGRELLYEESLAVTAQIIRLFESV